MRVTKFQKSRFYLRRDPDAGWTLALGKWRILFQVVVCPSKPSGDGSQRGQGSSMDADRGGERSDGVGEVQRGE